MTRSLAKTEALLLVMVLAGEEIPDHLQKLAAEHPDTDPFLAALNRYHRMEEARHLSFARTRAAGGVGPRGLASSAGASASPRRC